MLYTKYETFINLRIGAPGNSTMPLPGALIDKYHPEFSLKKENKPT
jgi:hypothetical protein